MKPQSRLARSLPRSRLGKIATGLGATALWCVPIIAGLALANFGGAPIDRLRSILFDEYQRLAPRQWSPKLPVKVIDIDDDSLARLGQWPWPRSRVAELTDKLAADGAAAIVFDIVFAEEDRLSPENLLRLLPDLPERDALAKVIAARHLDGDALVASFAKAPVVAALALAYDKAAQAPQMKSGFVTLGDDPRASLYTFPAAILPQPALAKAASGLGAITYIPDGDLIVRSLPLVFAVGPPGATQLVPSLSAEALRIATHSDTIIIKATNASGERSLHNTAVVAVEIGDLIIPTDRDGAVRVRYAGWQKERHIAAWRVLAGEAADEIAGRIVLVGVSAAALADVRSTPLNAAVPGVDIQAELLEHVLSGAHLTRPDFAPGVENVALVVGGLFTAWITRRMRPVPAALIAVGLVSGACAVSWFGFLWGAQLYDPLIPSATWLVAYATTTVVVYRVSERERRAVRGAFSRYLPPAVVERLAADPSLLKLGGEVRTVTVLFSDVRDFTERVESLSAESVVDFLNALHTALTQSVLNEAGTIDKYIGDGLMAFWNAPLDVADHASRACRAALDMLSHIPALDRALAAEAEARGRPYVELRIGIGINSGPVLVGNLGSEQRFDYSIVGDPVNVAARLEALTKRLGIPIVVSEATAHVATGFSFVELGEAELRGRHHLTRIHALHSVAEKDDASFFEFRALHEKALAAAQMGCGVAEAIAHAAAHPHGARYRHFYGVLAASGAVVPALQDHAPGRS
jgi:adenylate cyclase